MSFYISKVHQTNENGEDEFIYYTGNYHWSSNPMNRLIFDTAEEAAAHLYEFGGAVTDVEPAPYVLPTPVTTVETTPIAEEEPVAEEPEVQEEPVVEEPEVQEEPVDFSSSSTSTMVF